MASRYSKSAHQKYRAEYTSEWPCIIKSSRESYVFCKTCVVDFSIKHGGKYDITKHMKTSKHIDKCKIMQQCQPMSNALAKFLVSI